MVVELTLLDGKLDRFIVQLELEYQIVGLVICPSRFRFGQ